MEQGNRRPRTAPRRGTRGGKPGPSGPIDPAKVEERRTESPSTPGDGTAGPAQARQPEPTESFGDRRDIETADEPAEQHDRRHHDRGRGDVESGQPA
jgi:hypothetical protein